MSQVRRLLQVPEFLLKNPQYLKDEPSEFSFFIKDKQILRILADATHCKTYFAELIVLNKMKCLVNIAVT